MSDGNLKKKSKLPEQNHAGSATQKVIDYLENEVSFWENSREKLMKLEKIQLRGWRQFKDIEIECDPKITILVGKNGSLKFASAAASK